MLSFQAVTSLAALLASSFTESSNNYEQHMEGYEPQTKLNSALATNK